MLKSKIAALILLFVFVLVTGVVVFKFNLIRARGSDECFACHEDKTLAMDVNGKKKSIFVDPVLFKNSTHSAFDCKDCHEGYNPDEFPHNPKKVKINCRGCHEKAKSLENGVHKNNDCADCHNPHNQKPAKEMKANQTATCLKCHTNRNVTDYNTSIHAKKNVGCDGCHKSGHDAKKITKGEVVQVCGNCHGSHQKDFNNSIHQTVMKGGNKNTPTCIDCHGSHKIVGNKMSIESIACLKCHLDEKLFPGDQKGSAKFVAKYKTSIHSSIQIDGKQAAGCVDCHGNHMIESTNDPTKSTVRARMMETCGKCHTKEIDHYYKSSHGQAYKNGDNNAPTCFQCHGEHGINSVLRSDDFSKINQTEMCLSCHQDNRVNKNKETHLNDYKKSFHYIALQNGNTKAATCSNCHGPHEMKPASDPESQIYKKNVDGTCGQIGCHEQEKKDYSGSIHHTTLMSKENSDSPTCNSCHGAHQVVNTDSLGKDQGSKQKGIVKLCSNCHASVELVRNNNLPNVASNYNESFHGLAVRGGSNKAASCGSCHGNHNIRPSTDSLSTINKKNLGQTCGKCHPGADNVFLNTKMHILKAETDNPMLFWITRFYILMIIGVIGGMVLHNILDYRRKLKEKKAGQ
ncbi:MAG: cytochrome c3 family protein [Ignavibacteriae bacterium]|nr:cytochrome c3 family protein [Ignavibacteriota bacterium]